MKYAAVAAALVSAVVADGWESWSTTSSWDPKGPPPPHGPHGGPPPKPTATSEWQTWSTSSVDPATWSTWDPKGPPPPPPMPTTTSPAGWENWATTSAKCSYVTEVATSKCMPGHPDKCWPWKTTSTVYPDDCGATTWATWSVPEQATTTECSCSYVTEIATSKCMPGHPDQCWPYMMTSTVYPENCETTTWAEWNTWTSPTPTPVVPTWAECSYVTEVPVTKCWPDHKDKNEHCWVGSETTTVYPTACATWGEWTTTIIVVGETTVTKTWYPYIPTPVTPVEATTTWAAWTTETPVAAVTTIVNAGWQENGWFGPAWPVAGEGQCVTNVVTSYGYPIWQPTPEASSVVADTTTCDETTTWAQWTSSTPVAETTTCDETTTWAEWTSTPVAETTTCDETTAWATWTASAVATVKPAPAKGGKAPIAPNGNQWAMTYGPYDSTGNCKTKEVIYADVLKIKNAGFTTIRVYSTDCYTLEYIGGACREYGLTIILGVFISQTGIEGAKPQVEEIITWGQWDIVELIVIGNEAVFQGFCQPSELVEFITYCKTKFAACGYTGPCTTTEPLNEWQKSSAQYCEVVDVVSANLYAYFNADCPASNAGEFIQSEIVILEGLCSGKETYVMECGWPSEGQCNGKACAGVQEQEIAITGIKNTCGAKIVFFNYENEEWKQPGQFGVEQHWGLYDVFAGKGENWSGWSKA